MPQYIIVMTLYNKIFASHIVSSCTQTDSVKHKVPYNTANIPI